MFPFLKKLFADGGYQGPEFNQALARVLPYPSLMKAPIWLRSSSTAWNEAPLSDCPARIENQISTSQEAWVGVEFHKDSALVQWYRARVETGASKTKMVVALAGKRLIGLWRMVTTGEMPQGIVLRPEA